MKLATKLKLTRRTKRKVPCYLTVTCLLYIEKTHALIQLQANLSELSKKTLVFFKSGNICMETNINDGQGRNQGERGGAEPPLKKILPPYYKKLVTIMHDNGIGNLAPSEIFFAPLSICF